MASPILITKLFIPPTRAQLVQRPELIERLKDGLDRKLTLLSAPAGFGKTTLVSRWVENLRNNSELDSQSIKVAWLSLDQDDNDPVRFLIYFITALNQIKEIDADLGQGALSILQSPQPPLANTVLISLINDLAAIHGKIVFILDDYHLIESEPIHQALVFLLENLPPQLHLVIATRQDPPLSLGRLRVRDQMTELRAADLRFSSSEAADFLNQVMGLNLSPEDIAELEIRTEGWIAGLQLAAISMQGRGDSSSFIKSFTGSNRLVLDYLIEEVLNQQSKDIQSFLLQTSILNRMNGSLCNAVTGNSNSQSVLEMLERANLFIVPLDGERHWYRYHHLFGDLLCRRLLHHQPETIPKLHERASYWFEANNLINEAVDHALANRDIRRAAQLIQNHAEELFQHGGLLALVDWIQTLPDDIASSQPWQYIYQGWVLIVWMLGTTGRYDSVKPVIDQLEAILKSEKVNPTEKQELFANITAMRVFLAVMLNNQSQIIELASGFEEKLTENSLWASSLCHWVQGMDYRLKSDYQTACESFRKAVRDGKAMNNAWISVMALTDLAEICLEQGQLHQATAIYEEALNLADEISSRNVCDMGPVEAGLALIKYEQNDLTTAHHLAINSVRHSSSPNQYVFTYEILARILLAQDDFLGSLEAINQVDKINRSYPVLKMLVSSTEQTRVRIWIAQDDTLAIEEWLAEYRESAINDEILSLTLARIYIYQNKLDEALSLLNHLGSQVISAQRKNLLIETQVLQSVVLLKQDQIGQALKNLENSLDMAAPQGYVRVYVDAGSPMSHLLLTARSREIHADYIHQLLAAFPGVKPEQIDKPQIRNSEFDWIEPLSDRESEVLQLLAKGLTNQVIADRLVLSIHTVKTHTRSIYSKLAVNNRTQAVDRARTLGILPPI